VRYVLAVAKGHQVTTGLRACRADKLTASLPARAWQRLSAGPGAKGHRCYDWAWVAIDPGRPGHRWLLARRNRLTRELAFYRCYCPRHIPLATLVKVAGLRWTAESTSRPARAWPGWMSIRSAAGPPGADGSPWPCSPPRSSPSPTPPNTPHSPEPAGQIPLTRNEIAGLFATVLIQPARDARHRLRWSTWRRHHQHRAKTCHYQRQARQL
jgi:hypothetical protein